MSTEPESAESETVLEETNKMRVITRDYDAIIGVGLIFGVPILIGLILGAFFGGTNGAYWGMGVTGIVIIPLSLALLEKEWAFGFVILFLVAILGLLGFGVGYLFCGPLGRLPGAGLGIGSFPIITVSLMYFFPDFFEPNNIQAEEAIDGVENDEIPTDEETTLAFKGGKLFLLLHFSPELGMKCLEQLALSLVGEHANIQSYTILPERDELEESKPELALETIFFRCTFANHPITIALANSASPSLHLHALRSSSTVVGLVSFGDEGALDATLNHEYWQKQSDWFRAMGWQELWSEPENRPHIAIQTIEPHRALDELQVNKVVHQWLPESRHCTIHRSYWNQPETLHIPMFSIFANWLKYEQAQDAPTVGKWKDSYEDALF